METTLTINNINYDAITRAAKQKGISRSDMIVALLKKVMVTVSGPSRYGRGIQYQERSTQCSLRPIHISLREDDYEYILDLRKLLKMSVSCILALAIKKYLKHIVITDNYRYKNYAIIKNCIEGITYWIYIWGYPRCIERFLPKKKSF